MAKEKFIYNTQTLRYEKVEISTRERIIKTIAFLCAVIVGGAVFTVLVWNFFPSPELTKEKNYNKKISEQLIELEGDLENMNSVLSNIQERDASVHRIMFGMDPIDENLWNGKAIGKIAGKMCTITTDGRNSDFNAIINHLRDVTGSTVSHFFLTSNKNEVNYAGYYYFFKITSCSSSRYVFTNLSSTCLDSCGNGITD